MDKQSACNQEEIVVFGYLRDIEFFLKNNSLNIIPHSIYELCYKFYRYYIKIGIAYSTTDLKQYGIMDFQSKYISKYKSVNTYQYNRDFYISYPLNNYVENVSNKITNLTSVTFNNCLENISYHGIFGKVMKKETSQNDNDAQALRKRKPYPYFALFDPAANNEINYFYPIISSQEMPNFDSILYCNKRSAMFGEYDGTLYELKLSDIKDLQFGFKVLNKSNMWQSHKHMFSRQTFLILEYLNDIDTIFGISCTGTFFSSQKKQFASSMTVSKCGLYDFQTNEWSKIKPFECPWDYKMFLCITCYNRNMNTVYIQTNCGYTANYNVVKDEWQYVLQNKLETPITKRQHSMGKLWIDEQNTNILNWARKTHIKQLDLRVKERKWMNVYDLIENNYTTTIF